jgi:hypothetical protein
MYVFLCFYVIDTVQCDRVPGPTYPCDLHVIRVDYLSRLGISKTMQDFSFCIVPLKGVPESRPRICILGNDKFSDDDDDLYCAFPI